MAHWVQCSFVGSTITWVDPTCGISTGGKGDNPSGGDARRHVYKPTGILERPKKKARTDVENRVDESREIEAEIAGRLAKEFGEETIRIREEGQQIEAMSQEAIAFEIGVLLRKKIKTEQDEITLMLLMAASIA